MGRPYNVFLNGSSRLILFPSLENDLRALRLLHDLVIDTAIVFPHDKGVPYRRALRDMCVVSTSRVIWKLTGQ